jgi:predicted Rossmann fold flavoprotein
VKHLIVIGGGAAGFFCAINAARLNPGLKVTIVEKTGKLLSKVKVSGGGRCNVTHACFDITEMSKRYPRGNNFVKKIFHQFFTTDTIEWFRERGVQLKTETDGRMFPVTDSSQTIVDCLLNEASRYGVSIVLNKEVKNLLRTGDHFTIELKDTGILVADYVCVACGGYPRTDMFDWLLATGHTIEPPVPSLFTFNLPGHPIRELMGVSVPHAVIKLAGTKQEQEGPLLITHWGLSGPAVLKLSAWGAKELAARNYHFSVLVNWLPGMHENELSRKFQSLRYDIAAQKIGTKNPFGLPARLWEFLLQQCGIKTEIRWADLPAKESNKLVKQLCSSEFAVKGKTTFKEEFVTAGGIKLNEVDHTNLMSKKVPNLFFAGEILDVDGVTGGFNFQHAWSTGFIAAESVAGSS